MVRIAGSLDHDKAAAFKTGNGATDDSLLDDAGFVGDPVGTELAGAGAEAARQNFGHALAVMTDAAVVARRLLPDF